MTDFDRALRQSEALHLDFSFFDREGAPCSFSASVLAVDPREIWVEVPAVIDRIQRRAFYRVKADPGMEVVFQDVACRGITARIRDYSLGGLAFYQDLYDAWFSKLAQEDQLCDNRIIIPDGRGILEIPVALAVVRRIVVFPPHTIQGALEFLQVPDPARAHLGRLVFEHQRQVIQKIKGTEAQREFSNGLHLRGNRLGKGTTGR